jgi:hypothetical protein
MFWLQLGQGGLADLSEAALEGVLERIESGPDGDLYTVYMTALSATTNLNREQAIVLRKSVHGELVQSSIGTRCRLAAGRVRPDGRFGADFSTVVLAASSSPRLENPFNLPTAAPGAQA